MKKLTQDRRSNKDRRKFCYTSYSPERRSGIDRRIVQQKLVKEKVA